MGSARPLRQRLAGIARSAGMQLCGAGGMGFEHVAHGRRAIGYTEPPLPAGPVALATAAAVTVWLVQAPGWHSAHRSPSTNPYPGIELDAGSCWPPMSAWPWATSQVSAS